MDTPPDGTAPVTSDLTGCRWWLLKRAPATAQTKRLAEAYAQEALAWMIEDGVAQRIDVNARWINIGQLAVDIAIIRSDGARPLNLTFDPAWSATLAA
jgi:phage gp46-like protein